MRDQVTASFDDFDYLCREEITTVVGCKTSSFHSIIDLFAFDSHTECLISNYSVMSACFGRTDEAVVTKMGQELESTIDAD